MLLILQKVSKEDMLVIQHEVRRSARNVGKQLDYKEPTLPVESKVSDYVVIFSLAVADS